MADKGIPEMSPEMLEAFKAFYKQYATPESTSKQGVAVEESSSQPETEKVDLPNQAIPSMPESTSTPLMSSPPKVDDSDAVKDTPPSAVQETTSLPVVPPSSIPVSTINMEEATAVIVDVVNAIEQATLSSEKSPQVDHMELGDADPNSTAQEPEPATRSLSDAGAAADVSANANVAADDDVDIVAVDPNASLTPTRFKNMSTLDVVRDVLGLVPPPLAIIPPGEPENPLDCDREIDLEPTARDLLKEGKAGKMPVRSSARIREDTISKMVKKGDERRERKKAAASNVERGLIDETTPEQEVDVDLSFDDSEDVNFEPASPHSSSELGAAVLATEKTHPSSKAKRKLDVELGVGGKPAPKAKKPKALSPAVSSHSAQGTRPSKGKKKIAVHLSSSDSSLEKQGKSHRSKTNVPAPPVKKSTPKVSPKPVKSSTAAKSSRARSRANVGQSSTPTFTSADEPVSAQMVAEARSNRFVSQINHDALSILKSREFRAEKRINPPMFVKYGIDLLLKERGLWLTLTNVYPYNLNVVREFYANLSVDCGVVESPRYGKVYVRGSVYSFSPETINGLFGLPSVEISDWILDGNIEKALVTELTGGRVKKWDSRFQSTKLTCKYAVLHKIAVACWMLSKNTQIVTKDQALMIFRVGKGLPVNFGQFVFNAVLKAASDSTGTILYPNVIFQVLAGQGLEATPTEGVEVEQLTFSNSLLTSDRKQDLPYKSKVHHKGTAPSESEDSLFAEINQFKGSDAAGPSTQSVSKSVQTVLSSLPSMIQSAEALLQGLKEVQEVLKAAEPSLSDAES